MEKDCRFCNNYDFDKSQRCKIPKECTTFGDGPQTYARYKEVDSTEKTRRQCLLNAETLDSKEKFLHDFTSIVFSLVFLSAIVVCILLAISSFIHSWSHPEMTRMQVLQWSLSKYWIGYVYSIGVLLFSKFFISML